MRKTASTNYSVQSKVSTTISKVNIKKGLEIETTHSKKTRKYKVFKIGENSARNEIFEMRNGTKKSIYDYFFEQYQIRLIYPELPCVILTNKTILPLEVVNVCAGQRYIKK